MADKNRLTEEANRIAKAQKKKDTIAAALKAEEDEAERQRAIAAAKKIKDLKKTAEDLEKSAALEKAELERQCALTAEREQKWKKAFYELVATRKEEIEGVMSTIKDEFDAYLKQALSDKADEDAKKAD